MNFLGTMVLMVFGNGIGASISLTRVSQKVSLPIGLLLFISLAVTLGVYTTGFTGGRLNPAVTIAFAVGGIFPWSKVGYIIAQILGALSELL